MFFDKRFKSTLLTSVSMGAVLIGTNALANPEGANVVTGDVAINGLGTDHVIIQNDSNRSVVNWDQFSIGAGEATTINQITDDSAILNRVVTDNVSEIYGTLESNGQVFLVNQSGIVIGASGIVDTNGLVASTLDVSNTDFLGAGEMIFSQGIEKAGGIEIHGKVRSVSGGDIFLLSREITIGASAEINSEGGYVGLGAGEEILLRPTDTGDGRISIRAGKGKIVNQGMIAGAVAELKAAGGNEYALAINNTGVVRATGYSKKGGKIRLGGGGKVRNTGKLVARKKVIVRSKKKIENSGQIKAGDGNNGGEIIFEAPEIEVKTDSILDVAGALGGGRIFVGGGYQGTQADSQGNAVDITDNAINVTVDDGAVLTASATQSGDAGEIVVWADGETVFAGDIVATAVDGDGGQVEVSGKQTLGYRGAVDASSKNGKAGQLLLDPENLTIIATGTPTNGEILDSDIENVLKTGTGVTVTTGSAGASGSVTASVPFTSAGATGDDGDVVFNAGVRIVWGGDDGSNTTTSTDATFTVIAENDIKAEDNVQIQHFNSKTANGGGVVFTAGNDIIIGKEATRTAFTNASINGAVTIGSENGKNTFTAGNDISITGGDTFGAYAHLGFVQGSVGTGTLGNGDITVAAGNNVTLQGGADGATFAQIGHGGASPGATMIAAIAADITVTSDSDGSGGGNVIFTHATKTSGASGSSGSHAQIGHGSYMTTIGADVAFSQGDISGKITLTTGDATTPTADLLINNDFVGSKDGTIDELLSQVGHGGRVVYSGSTVDDNEITHGEISGDIDLNIHGKIVAGTDASPAAGDDQYVIQSKIGHGGQATMAYSNFGVETSDDNSFDAVHENISGDINVTAGQIDLIAKDAALNSALGDGTLVDNSQQSQIGHGSTTVFNRDTGGQFGETGQTIDPTYTITDASLTGTAVYNVQVQNLTDVQVASLTDAQKTALLAEIDGERTDSNITTVSTTAGRSLDKARNVTITDNRISGNITVTDDTSDDAGVTLDAGIAVGLNAITKDVMVTRIGHASVVGVDSLHGNEDKTAGSEVAAFNGGNVTIRQAHILGADILVDTSSNVGKTDDIILKTSIAAGLSAARDNTTVAQIGHGGDVFVGTGNGGNSSLADVNSGDGGDITLIRGTVWDGGLVHDNDADEKDALAITNTTDIFVKSANEVIIDSDTAAALSSAERNNSESSIGHGFKQRLVTGDGGSSTANAAAGGAGGDILVYQGLDVREYGIDQGINTGRFDDYAYGLRGDIYITASNKDGNAINLTSDDTSALSKTDFNTDLSTIGHGDVLEAVSGKGGDGASGLDEEGDNTTTDTKGQVAVYGGRGGHIDVQLGRHRGVDQYSSMGDNNGSAVGANMFSDTRIAGGNQADVGDTRALTLGEVAAPKRQGLSLIEGDIFVNVLGGTVNVAGSITNALSPSTHAISESIIGHAQRFTADAGDGGLAGTGNFHSQTETVFQSEKTGEQFLNYASGTGSNRGGNGGDVRLTYGDITDRNIHEIDTDDHAEITHDTDADHSGTANVSFAAASGYSGSKTELVDGSSDIFMYLHDEATFGVDTTAQTNPDSLIVKSTINSGLSEKNGSIYSTVGHHVRLIGEGGVGGAGNSTNTEFDQDGNDVFDGTTPADVDGVTDINGISVDTVDETAVQIGAVFTQPNSSGGRGGDALVVNNNISGDIVINAARRVTVQAGDGHGGDTIINATLGHTTDLFAATQAGGAAGSLHESGANATFDGGIINVGGGQNTDNAANAPGSGAFPHLLVDGNRDDQFNLENNGDSQEITGVQGVIDGEDGIAVTDKDRENRTGSTFSSIHNQFGSDASASTTAVIFHDEEADPQYILKSATPNDFVINNQENNSLYADKDFNTGRYGRVVATYDGTQTQGSNEFFSLGGAPGTEGRISLEVFVDMDRDGDVDLVDFDRDGRLDIVDVDRDGYMDVIDGRANYVDVRNAVSVPQDNGSTNGISGLGVLDYVAVTGKGFNQTTAKDTGENWTNHNELKSDDLLSVYNNNKTLTVDGNAGVDSDFTAYVSDFSTANGGRGGDAYSQVGYTSGDISVSTGDNDKGEADSLIVKTTAPDATAGNGSDDYLRAIIGHNAVQMSDAGGKYSAYRVGREGLNMESDEHGAAKGGAAGDFAINGNGGRGGNAAIIQGVARDHNKSFEALTGINTELDHLVGDIFINKINDLDGSNSKDSGRISITGDVGGLAPINHNLVSQIGHSSLALAAADDGGIGASKHSENSDAGNSSQTELADGGDGGDAFIIENHVKGDITVMAGGDDLDGGTADFSIEMKVSDADPTSNDTLIAQIGHGRQAYVTGGTGGDGDDGQFRGNGGAGGNATLTQNEILDSVVTIDLVDHGLGYDGNGMLLDSTSITGTNDIFRVQVGHGDLGYATAGNGGAGTPKFFVLEQRNQTANGGIGGDAIINQAGYNHDIIVDLGANEKEGKEALQIISSAGATTNGKDDHLLATIGHGGMGEAIGGDGGAGGLNGVVTGIPAAPSAVDPNLTNGDYFDTSTTNNLVAEDGDHVGAVDLTAQMYLGTTRRGGDAGDGVVNLNVRGTGRTLDKRAGVTNDYGTNDLDGADITITVSDLFDDGATPTKPTAGYDGVLIKTITGPGSNQDSSLYVNAALVGHHGFGNGKGGAGGDGIQSDETATISDGDGGDGGTGIANIAEVRGNISINNNKGVDGYTDPGDVDKSGTDKDTNITITTVDSTSSDALEHRGDARVGHMSQAQSTGGQGGKGAKEAGSKPAFPATISTQGGDGGDALTFQGQQEGNIALEAENSVIISAKEGMTTAGALVAAAGHRVVAESKAGAGGTGGTYAGEANNESIYFTYEALREFHHRRASGASDEVAFSALSEFEQQLVAPITDYFENKQGELEIFLDRLVGDNPNVIAHNERDNVAATTAIPELVAGDGHIKDADDGEIETLTAILAASGHGGNAVVAQGSTGLSGHSDELAASGDITITAKAFDLTDDNRGITVEGVAGSDTKSFELGHVGHQAEAHEVTAGKGSDLTGALSDANGIGGDGGDAVVDQYALNGGIDLVSDHKIKVSSSDGGSGGHETRAWVGHRLTVGSDFTSYRTGNASVTAGNGGNEKADSGQDDGHNGNGGDVFIYQRGVISGATRGSTINTYDTEISLTALEDTIDDKNSITIEAKATAPTAPDVETHIGHDFLIHGVKAGDAGRQGPLTGPQGASEGLLEGNGGDIFIAQTDLGADIDIVGRDTINIFANATTSAGNHAHLMIGHERTIGNSAELDDTLDGEIADNPRLGTIVAGFGGDAYTEDVNGTAMASRDAAKLGIIEDADSGRIEIALGKITDSADGDDDTRLVTIISLTEDVDIKSDANMGKAILEIGNQQQVIAKTQSASEFTGDPKTQTAGDAGGIYITRDTIDGDILIQAIDADRANSEIPANGKQVVIDSKSVAPGIAITQIGHETQFTADTSVPVTARAAFGEDRNFLFADGGKLDTFQKLAGTATLGDAQNAVEDMRDLVRALKLANENADRYTSAEQTQLSGLITSANDALSAAVTSLNSVGTASGTGTISEASAVGGVVTQAQELIAAATGFQNILSNGSVPNAGGQIADFAEGGDIVYGQNLTLTGDNPLNSHTDSIDGVDGLDYVSDLSIQHAPALKADNLGEADLASTVPVTFKVTDTGTVSGNVDVLSGRYSGISSITDLTSLSQIMGIGIDAIVADTFSAANTTNTGDDLDDSVVMITADADKRSLSELGHRRIMKNTTDVGGGDSDTSPEEGGVAGDAGSIVTSNTTIGDISVQAEEVIITTKGLSGEGEVHLLHSSHTTNIAGWSDIEALLGNGGDIYNNTIVSGGATVNAEWIASSLDGKDRKLLADGATAETFIHFGHQAEDHNHSQSDTNEKGTTTGDTQDNLGSNRGGKIVSSQTVKGNANDDLVIITLDAAGDGNKSDLNIEATGGGKSDIRLGNGEDGTEDGLDAKYGIHHTGSSGGNNGEGGRKSLDDGSEVTLTQRVSGDIKISDVEDLIIDNTGTTAKENIYIGHDAVQFGESGETNAKVADILQHGERVTVDQEVKGDVNIETSSTYTARVSATGGEIHVGHEATQSGFSADDGPTGDNDSFTAPDVLATQVIEAGISIVTGEITLENKGSTEQIHFGHEATHNAAVDGDQTVAMGDPNSTGYVKASSKINADGSDIRFEAKGATGQLDTIVKHDDINNADGDIQLDAKGDGKIQVGHSSTSQMGDVTTGSLVAEGKFDAEQIIGNATLDSNGNDVANTGDSVIEFQAAQDIIVASVDGETQVGHFIVEKGNASSTDDPLNVDGNAATGLAEGDSELRQIVGSDIIFGDKTNQRTGGVGENGAGNNVVIATGASGTTIIGHQSPEDNEWQVEGTRSVTVQLLDGDITIEAGTDEGVDAPDGKVLATAAAAIADETGTGDDLLILSGGGTARVGHNMSGQTEKVKNITQRSAGDIWARAGGDVHIIGGAVGHEHYDFDDSAVSTDNTNATPGSTIRDRIRGNTTIAAGQNSATEDSTTIANILKIDATDKAVEINSGYGGKGNKDVDGELRFFLPAQEGLTVALGKGVTFNDSASNSDAVPERSSNSENVFENEGGKDHEHPFEFASEEALYTDEFINDGNFTFYFEAKAAVVPETTPFIYRVGRETTSGFDVSFITDGDDTGSVLNTGGAFDDYIGTSSHDVACEERGIDPETCSEIDEKYDGIQPGYGSNTKWSGQAGGNTSRVIDTDTEEDEREGNQQVVGFTVYDEPVITTQTIAVERSSGSYFNVKTVTRKLPKYDGHVITRNSPSGTNHMNGFGRTVTNPSPLGQSNSPIVTLTEGSGVNSFDVSSSAVFSTTNQFFTGYNAGNDYQVTAVDNTIGTYVDDAGIDAYIAQHAGAMSFASSYQVFEQKLVE